MYLQFRSYKILKNANKSVVEKHKSSVTWEWGCDRVGQEVPLRVVAMFTTWYASVKTYHIVHFKLVRFMEWRLS